MFCENKCFSQYNKSKFIWNTILEYFNISDSGGAILKPKNLEKKNLKGL